MQFLRNSSWLMYGEGSGGRKASEEAAVSSREREWWLGQETGWKKGTSLRDIQEIKWTRLGN